jgi:protoporphyrinogen oxidase
MTEADAVRFACDELGDLGLIDPARVFDGALVRVPFAYPLRHDGDDEEIDSIRDYLDGFENLETFGRGGLHREDTQDAAMLSGMLATVNLLEGSSDDVWADGERGPAPRPVVSEAYAG